MIFPIEPVDPRIIFFFSYLKKIKLLYEEEMQISFHQFYQAKPP